MKFTSEDEAFYGWVLLWLLLFAAIFTAGVQVGMKVQRDRPCQEDVR